MKMALRTLVSAALLCSAANATILTFRMTLANGTTDLTNGWSIPQVYGDNVSNSDPNATSLVVINNNIDRRMWYEKGTGWTPNVTAEWSTRNIAAPNTKLDSRSVGYVRSTWGVGDQAVILDDPGQYFAELVLQADSGLLVELSGFRLSHKTAPVASQVLIGATNGTSTDWTTLNLTVPSGSWYNYAPATTLKAESIVLRWAYGDANIAMDHINFNQQLPTPAGGGETPDPDPDPGASTPEPGTMFCAAAALIGLGWLRRR
jgi:hypothetical protein